MTPELARAVRQAFTEAPLCFLATSQPGGEPNVVPVGFKWVEGGRLLLADLFFGRTRLNLAATRRVAVAVALLDPKRGFQVKAVAKVHREGPVYDRVCELLRSQGVEARPRAAIEIPFDEVYGLAPGPEAGKRLD
ncbi:MAG: pyridoxamine 5'-phosphate oxidase family protein [Archangiaceae bacterium]|nr:pyridoxamine 5'-phosphate oxidase family protein [Archangiaceae bacterium]